MSNLPFDFNLPFEAFAPFNMLASPAQHWLDVLAGTARAMTETMARTPPYQSLLAGQADPFKAMGWPAPASPPDWADACARASAVLSKAQSNATRQQTELCQSWLAAQPSLASAADAGGLHERLERLHGQTVQALAQLRGINDEYLEAWFAAAGIIADAWPAPATGESAAGQPKPAASPATPKRR